jgi:hypothetical protein
MFIEDSSYDVIESKIIFKDSKWITHLMK